MSSDPLRDATTLLMSWAEKGAPVRECEEIAARILAAHPSEAVEPACRHGCGECHPDPGPWHQRGCPSWRALPPEDPSEAGLRIALDALELASRELHHGNSNPGTRAEVGYTVDQAIASLRSGGDGWKEKREAFVAGAKWLDERIEEDRNAVADAQTEAARRYPAPPSSAPEPPGTTVCAFCNGTGRGPAVHPPTSAEPPKEYVCRKCGQVVPLRELYKHGGVYEHSGHQKAPGEVWSLWCGPVVLKGEKDG